MPSVVLPIASAEALLLVSEYIRIYIPPLKFIELFRYYVCLPPLQRTMSLDQFESMILKHLRDGMQVRFEAIAR